VNSRAGCCAANGAPPASLIVTTCASQSIDYPEGSERSSA
jgi:hypothetical protein